MDVDHINLVGENRPRINASFFFFIQSFVEPKMDIDSVSFLPHVWVFLV